MLMPARRHRLSAWIAIAAMLAFALVPTISRALAFADSGSGWTELCTSQGMQRVPVAADAAAAGHGGERATPGFDVCGFCSLTGEASSPLIAAHPAPQLPSCSVEAPAAFWQAPRTLHAWAGVLARAPPRLG